MQDLQMDDAELKTLKNPINILPVEERKPWMEKPLFFNTTLVVLYGMK